ncbi:MAG: DUF364 domain-containing protein [Candidatus Bathyarchaeia archaeon]
MEDLSIRILSEIVSSIKNDAEIRGTAFGLRFNLVKSRHTGIASTLGEPFLGKIKEKSAKELAKLSFSDNVSHASVGVAAINSLIDVDEERCIEINASKIIEKLAENKNISVIGHFPFVDELKKVAKNVWVFEKRLKEGDLPFEAKDEFLKTSDVVAISGTTLINRTFPSIIRSCRKDAITILLGPSTPLSEVIFDYGANNLEGVIIENEKEAELLVNRGCTFREMKAKGIVSLLTIAKEKKLVSGGG